MDKLRGKFFATIIAILVNLLLAITKLYIGLRTNSLSITSDSINNFGDVIMAVIVIIGLSFLLKKADEKYPNGLGRIEYIIGFLMSIVLTIVGITFIYSSLERFFYARPVWFEWNYFYILLASIVVKLLLGFYFKWVNKKQNSQMFKIMSIDSFVDSIITIMVVASFLMIQFTLINIDAIFSLIISIVIVVNGIKLIKNSCNSILEKNNDDIDLIKYCISGYKGVITVGEAVYHDYGSSNKYYSISVIFEDNLQMGEIKDIIDDMKEIIFNEYKCNVEIVLKGETYD